MYEPSEDGRSRHSQVIDQKRFSNLTLVTLTFDPVTPKSIQFLCYPGCICGPSLKKV